MLTDASLATLPEAVRGRRSIRRFRDEQVPREEIEGLLRDAVWAPSPHNSQPWRFTVLFDSAQKQRLASDMADQLARELSADGLAPDVIERQAGRSRVRISSAPVVTLCSLVSDGLVQYPDRRRNDLEWKMAVQSVGSVMQTLFLLASVRGIGSCWMAAPMYCPDIVRSALSLPDSYAPQALALLGYPASEGKIRQRRSLSEVVELR